MLRKTEMPKNEKQRRKKRLPDIFVTPRSQAIAATTQTIMEACPPVGLHGGHNRHDVSSKLLWSVRARGQDVKRKVIKN